MSTHFKRLKLGTKHYLIIAAMPTPNGRLHLGHMSGPYLKTDVIARSLKRNGNDVRVISGCDGFESYVEFKAWQIGKSTEEVCHYYANLSLRDLASLDVHYDGYVNPMASDVRQGFMAFAQKEMQALVDKGLTEVREETFLYSPSGDRFLVGCWLAGKCPNCGSNAASYQCEDCGIQFRPMDIVDPHSRAGDKDLVEISDFSIYLKILQKEKFWNHIDNMQIDDTFRKIVASYLDFQGYHIRLTNPGHFGIPWEIEGSSIPHVIYTATYMNAFMVYMGNLYIQLTGSLVNPFHPDSDVTTMVTFGIDCTIPYLLGMSWAIESGTFKPVDHALANFFCNLEDSKFSTSRGHAIWGEDIVTKTPVTSDIIRYYLVLINPEHNTTHFRIDHFIKTVNNELADRLQRILDLTWQYLGMPVETEPPAGFPMDLFETLLIDQNECLQPPRLEMAKGLLPLNAWVDLAYDLVQDTIAAYWWLKGFAMLSYPIMPNCATVIWRMLGHQNEPREQDFFLLPIMQKHECFPMFFREISYDEIKVVLPNTLYNTAT